MKKALFFIQNGLGGAERIQIEIAKMLISNGWMIKFSRVASLGTSDKIEQFYPGEADKSVLSYTSQFDFLRKLYHEIKTYNPTVVFASAIHINIRILLLSSFFPKIKFVVRNDNYLFTLPMWKRLLLTASYKLADKVISQTEEMEDELVKIGIKRSNVITLHNPVNVEEIIKNSDAYNPYKNNKKLRFVAVGRFAPQKGFDILLEAFNIVSKEKQDVELYIVGNYDYGNKEVWKQLNRLISKYSLSEKVFFPGFKENPYPYIKNADVFVLSSRYEGLPNALIEAQTLGKPCAATQCIPIISRIISNGINGYTAQSENPPELAQAMLKALKLSEIERTYTPATQDDFIDLFNNLLLV